MSLEEKPTETSADSINPAPQMAPWARATLADLSGLDFEAPVAQSTSAESTELGDLFGTAARALVARDQVADTPGARVFQMLAGTCGMLFKSEEPNQPFAAMAIFPGRRSAIPSDFMGPPLEALAEMAARAKHPVLRARLGDLCWLLDRKKAILGGMAAAAYVEIVDKVDRGELKFQFDEDARGALRHRARDLLRRALLIGRAIGMEKAGPAAARAMVVNLRKRAVEKLLPVPALWFGHLELDFRITDAGQDGEEIEALIARLPATTDTDTTVNLWRLAARAYHLAKRDNDRHRCQIAAAEQLATTAERQPMAMVASHVLSQAIAELHGVPGQKERRKELRHRLVDVQAGIVDEMSAFSHPIDLAALVQYTEQQMQRLSLRDKLFVFAALMSSPDPAQLAEEAKKRIREFPLSSLFAATHHDREGKVVHRSEGAGFGDSADNSALERQIAQDEGIRRKIGAGGKIEVARQAILNEHHITPEMLAWILAHSPFVSQDVVMTYSRGFARFFQGDFVSGLYILTPLLENSLRHVLKSHGHDVTKLDDATLTQEDRTISSLFDQMHAELVSIFGEAITTDIERVFLKKPGPYLRHSVAHGLLHDGDPYGEDAIYGCWLIFHLCLLPLFEHREQLSLPFDDFLENVAPPPAGAPVDGDRGHQHG
jgi:hypothetical protein